MQKNETVSEKIAAARKVVILSHRSPDGDSIGSSLALWHVMKKKGKEVNCITPDPAPVFLSWLEGFEQINNFERNEALANQLIGEADLIFCLDYNDPSRTAGLQRAFEENQSAYKINIDHHQHPKQFCDFQINDDSASSTAELIYRFFEDMDYLPMLDKASAEAIYTGIVTDTGSFRFSATTARTHEVVAHLLTLGVKPDKVHQMVYDSYSAERLKLLGYALHEALKIYDEHQVAIISLTESELKRFHFKKGDTEGLVNFPLSIKKVMVSILLTEKDGMIKMSFRSKDKIAVNNFASKYFQGGGHLNAAGGASFEDMESTIEKIELHLDELS